VTVHCPRGQEPARVLENRGRVVDRFGRVRPNLFVGVNSCAKILAVVGCHESTDWTLADQRESEWTSMDAPQTVLKTVWLPSTTVRERAPQFGRKHRWSVIVRLRP
jgi:hypothetical protein